MSIMNQHAASSLMAPRSAAGSVVVIDLDCLLGYRLRLGATTDPPSAVESAPLSPTRSSSSSCRYCDIVNRHRSRLVRAYGRPGPVSSCSLSGDGGGGGGRGRRVSRSLTPDIAAALATNAAAAGKQARHAVLNSAVDAKLGSVSLGGPGPPSRYHVYHCGAVVTDLNAPVRGVDFQTRISQPEGEAKQPQSSYRRHVGGTYGEKKGDEDEGDEGDEEEKEKEKEDSYEPTRWSPIIVASVFPGEALCSLEYLLYAIGTCSLDIVRAYFHLADAMLRTLDARLRLLKQQPQPQQQQNGGDGGVLNRQHQRQRLHPRGNASSSRRGGRGNGRSRGSRGSSAAAAATAAAAVATGTEISATASSTAQVGDEGASALADSPAPPSAPPSCMVSSMTSASGLGCLWTLARSKASSGRAPNCPSNSHCQCDCGGRGVIGGGQGGGQGRGESTSRLAHSKRGEPGGLQLAHSLTRSLTGSLVHSPTHWLAHSPINWLARSLIRSSSPLTHSLIHSLG
eukprot:GHVU01090408.1.p1 GENE.GHVU01090408.1~~GHVU01090408.1.p1  ORF type:complete len:511 (-),score=53.52 GHVU01090408.1:37-1569(-)